MIVKHLRSVALITVGASVLCVATPGVALGSPPTATTEAATNLNSPQVTLNGTVNPGGEDTAYRFEYGPTTAYGQSVPVTDKAIGSGSSDVEVSQQLGSLEPATTYHFRLVAENSQGEAVGEDEVFTTPEWAIADTDIPSGAKASTLTGGSCVSATACTVVGAYKNSSGVFVTLAERRDGGEWSIQPTPNPAGAQESRFRSVSCASSTACVAVGFFKDSSGAYLTLAERWDGSSWTILPTPNPAGALEARLESVSCASATECIAVGYVKTGAEAFSTLVERWDGTSWTIVSSPNPASLPKHYLRSVSCVSASECWAVGQSVPTATEQGEGKAPSAFAERFDGEAWSLHALPEAPENLASVSCSSASWCLAANGKAGTALQRWDGTSWASVNATSPSGGSPTFLAVTCRSATACTAVGTQPVPGHVAPLIERWDGSAWTIEPAIDMIGAIEGAILGGGFQAVSCSTARACVAAGFFYSNATGSIQTSMIAEAHPPGSPPTATTEAATNRNSPQVTLNGTVNPGGEDTAYRFEYGPTTAYGQSVPVPDKAIGSGTSDVEVSQQLGSLEPATTYHFRLVAENSQGEAVGEDEVFVPGPPQCQSFDLTAFTAVARSSTLQCSGPGELSYEVLSGPQHGSISNLNANDGTFTYTSQANFEETDSFTFAASNLAGISNTATVNIDVCPPPELDVSGEATEPGVPGVNLWIEAWRTEPGFCQLGEEEALLRTLRVYIDDEVVYSEPVECTDWSHCGPSGYSRGIQLPYAKLIGTHDLRLEFEDQFGATADLKWTETTPAEGTIASIPPEAEDSKGSSGCETPKNRAGRYRVRGETLYGTNCADIIPFRKGVKVFHSFAGDDTIRGSGRSEIITTGTGDDTVFGGRGSDIVRGEDGADRLYGGVGDDQLLGEGGDDALIGGAGGDVIRAGGGDDLVRGGPTQDELYGGAGTNTLSYADAVTPGFEANPESGSLNPQTNLVSGFPGKHGERGVYVNLTLAPNRISNNGGVARYGGGTDVLQKDTASEFQNVIGSPFADLIVGSADANVIDAGAGTDIVRAGPGADQVYGGADSDYLNGEAGQGADSVHGGIGSDTCVNGGEAASCESSNAGNGVEPVGLGSIGVGHLQPDHPGFPYTDLYLRGSELADSVTVTWSATEVTFVAQGSGTGRFDTALDDVSGCEVTASTANCPISGADSIVISGGPGRDVLKAHGFPNAMSVTLLGGAGVDTLEGGKGEDVLVDGVGSARDELYGNRSDDALFQNGGRDTLYGGENDDLFISSTLCEEDEIRGGDGTDNASWAQLAGAEIQPESETYPAYDQPVYENPGHGVNASLGEGAQKGVVDRVGQACAKTGELTNVESLEGSGVADVLIGNEEPNILLGRSGADRLLGRGGTDRLLANNRSEDSSDADQELDCGDGANDVLLRDPKDTNFKNCEEPEIEKAANASTSGISASPTAETALDFEEATLNSAAEGIVSPESGANPSGPSALFRLDETAGTTLDNSTHDPGEADGTHHNGVALGEPGAVAESNAVHLDGVDDYLDLTSQWDTDEYFQQTCWIGRFGHAVEMWVKFDSSPSGREDLFSRSEEIEGANLGFFVYRSSDGRLNFELPKWAGERVKVRTDESVSADEWHHVVAAYEWNNSSPVCTPNWPIYPRNVVLYVDGFAYALNGAYPVVPSTPAAHNLVGVRKDPATGFTGWLKGTVDNVSIYDHAVSEGEVAAHLAISEVEPPSVILLPQPDTSDSDGDGVTNGSDNCTEVPNSGQEDSDLDGAGDACQPDSDSDGDGIIDEVDNCPQFANTEQLDGDGNGVGDACESEE